MVTEPGGGVMQDRSVVKPGRHERSCACRLLMTLGAGLLLVAVPLFAAQSPDLRGIYVYSSDVSLISNGYANMVKASLSVPDMDGIVLVISWSALEPSMGQYSFTTLDQWMQAAVAARKKVDLAITAGTDTPSWLFLAPPTGAGATALNFTISPHSGATGVCDSETIAAPWDTAFQARWDALLAAVAAHLRTTGAYNALTLLRLTGINRTTDELRLPAETPQSTGLPCVSNAVTIWQVAGYKPSLLLSGWDQITKSFARSFPDKALSVAIIPQNAFPAIAEDGALIKGTPPDANQPLLSLASSRFPAHLVVQFNFLMPGEAASPAVIQYTQSLGTLAAFQTNNYFGSTGNGAACSEPDANPTPCTDATFLPLLQTGIYPLGTSNALRAQYIEVFPANANALPDDLILGHLELIPP